MLQCLWGGYTLQHDQVHLDKTQLWLGLDDKIPELDLSQMYVQHE